MTKQFARPMVFALLGVFSTSVAVAGISPVYDCGTELTAPGKYKLMNDLVACQVNGVLIRGSDITLNLNGHSISCAPSDERLGGVVVSNQDFNIIRNVTVKNGHISGCKDGVVLILTEDSKVTKISSSGNQLWLNPEGSFESGTGITVFLSSHNKITHNHTFGNATEGIATYSSNHNLFKHNQSTENVNGSGIWADEEHDSRFLCNRTDRNSSGLALGPFSSGNLVRGNVARHNANGIGAVGLAWDGFYFADIASDNVFKKNIATDNYNSDVFEVVFDLVTAQGALEPDNACLNAWKKNQFNLTFGPEGCFGYSAHLDADDVCALEQECEDD